MKRILVPALVLLCSAVSLAQPAGQASRPIAGRTAVGVTDKEMESIIIGWSAKRDMLGKPVVNDANEKIGDIEDIIITPDNAASYAVIGVGGFLGLGERRVSIPFRQIRLREGAFVLPGATKAALKSLPEFTYAARK